MSADISLEKLFEEQERPPEQLFVILPLDEQSIRIKPWNPRQRCICGSGFVKVPRSAIRSVKTTGKIQHCCCKTLQVVEIEFSEERTLTYKDLFATVRRSTRATSSAEPLRFPRRGPRAIKRPRIPILFPPFPEGDDEGGGGGGDEGFTGDPESDSAKYQLCIDECISTARLTDTGPPKTAQQLQQWIEQARTLCEEKCYNYLLTGDPNDDGS